MPNNQAAKENMTRLMMSITAPIESGVFLLRYKASISVPSITQPALTASPIPSPKKNPPKTEIKRRSLVTISKLNQYKDRASPIIATMVFSAKRLPIW